MSNGLIELTHARKFLPQFEEKMDQPEGIDNLSETLSILSGLLAISESEND